MDRVDPQFELCGRSVNLDPGTAVAVYCRYHDAILP